jgi:hypothetical protein
LVAGLLEGEMRMPRKKSGACALADLAERTPRKVLDSNQRTARAVTSV